MPNSSPSTVYLRDYSSPAYHIDTVDLLLELEPTDTRVIARLQLRRSPEVIAGTPLVLQGQELILRSLRLDGTPLNPGDYHLDDQTLTITTVPAAFELTIETRLQPAHNTSLEGLYLSNGIFCTQCEAEGFRKITYFLDRPDVMAVYTTTLVASGDYPVLLANGNLVEDSELDDGRHRVVWHDPYPKPSYLFALVGGRLECLEDHFRTASGRDVALKLYVEPGHLDQCQHAMTSLQKAMAWDEATYGCEYDLDIYMIVAVGDFNMGAMENKGLNIFNTKYVLAKPDTATDSDYQGIEGVIAHEYFHNWTGNRITCRDWFQLSLKEGLTVFRDQQFSADMGSQAVKRIDDVRLLRSIQFPQDAGPMAHPVRPESYIEINNFYTVTVYNKGAEVVRMLHTLLGADGFRAGMDLYFERFDGQAVTCDDFVAAMADASGQNLDQFRHWYSQSGTPEVQVTTDYDADTRVYTLSLRQSCPPTPGQAVKQPFHIPLAVGLLDSAGQPLPLQLQGENVAVGYERILELRETEQQFRFVGIDQPPTPSLLRGFSAPVKLTIDYSDEQLSFLLAHDSDAFNRWESAQRLAIRTLLQLVDDRQAGRQMVVPAPLTTAYQQLLQHHDLEPALLEQILTLPSESYLEEFMEEVDVEGIFIARQTLRHHLAGVLYEPLLERYQECQQQGYTIDAAAIGRRALGNRCLDYLVELDDPAYQRLCLEQYQQASNMTDTMGSLRLIANLEIPQRQEILNDFYERWQHEPLVVDKWFALQATSRLPGTLVEVERLLNHPAFTIKNPNKVRALIGAFCQGNPTRFHAADGSGYRFLANQVLILNDLNPQMAARLLGPFTRWRKYDRNRQERMRDELKRLLAQSSVAPDVYEVAAKSLTPD